MKHILFNKDGADFDSYFSYLKTVENKMPPKVYGFASNFDHYNLESHSSLHDAWLDYVRVIETAAGDRKQQRSVEIEMRFLGPFHDKRIYLNYKDVVNYEFKALDLQRGHGDLIIHELRLEEDSTTLVHELVFRGDSALLIKCGDILHREEEYSYR